MYGPSERLDLAHELADAFLAGPWSAESLAERAAGRLDRWPAWLNGLAFAAVALDRVAPLGRRVELVVFIDDYLREHPEDPARPDPPRIIRLLTPWAPATPATPAVPVTPIARTVAPPAWPVAPIASTAALAEQLELSIGQLSWLADTRGLERTAQHERLRNYRYRWVRRRSGLPRLLEIPKARLKEVQRWLLHEIIDHVAPHHAAHGFTPGRSVHSHAELHLGRRAVLRLDLRDFFASVSAGRVYGIFRAAGYQHAVAHTLTGLCTNAISPVVWNALKRPSDPRLVQPHFWLGRQLATPHLPQGAPTSPALANLAAFALDRRLSGLSAAFDLTYSRYADDLTFSGARLTRAAARAVTDLAATIVRDEGFRLHAAKSTYRGAAQRQVVTGIVVNCTPNVARGEYDRLRATLHRLALHGPGAAEPVGDVDLRAHLRGRVAWVASLHPARGARLRRQFDAIDWDGDGASGRG